MAAIGGEEPTIEERLGVAVASGDLTYRMRPCPLDKVVVLGWLARRYRLADGIIALKYANEASAYVMMLRALRGVAARLDRRHGWRLGPRLAEIAKTVLDYWLNDICASCSGAGHRAIDGAPGRAAKACHDCQGTGKKPQPWLRAAPRPPRSRNRAAMEAYRAAQQRRRHAEGCYRALLGGLGEAEGRIASEAWRLLR